MSVDSSDEEIKSVLLNARWHKEDAEAAILILRENKKTHETHMDSLHKVFTSDERLRPETVSALLGIEMDVMPEDMRDQSSQQSFGVQQLMGIMAAAFLLAVFMMGLTMWFMEVGMFHKTVRW